MPISVDTIFILSIMKVWGHTCQRKYKIISKRGYNYFPEDYLDNYYVSLSIFVDFATKKLILLGFLQTHGGIMIDGLFSFTENLSWIEDIINNTLINRGNRFF